MKGKKITNPQNKQLHKKNHNPQIHSKKCQERKKKTIHNPITHILVTKEKKKNNHRSEAQISERKEHFGLSETQIEWSKKKQNVSLSLSRLFFVTILGSAKMFHLICVQENGFHWFFGSGLVREREREENIYLS